MDNSSITRPRFEKISENLNCRIQEIAGGREIIADRGLNVKVCLHMLCIGFLGEARSFPCEAFCPLAAGNKE
jgi:hypothetical protein